MKQKKLMLMKQAAHVDVVVIPCPTTVRKLPHRERETLNVYLHVMWVGRINQTKVNRNDEFIVLISNKQQRYADGNKIRLEENICLRLIDLNLKVLFWKQ